jgi:hypothetical protein
VRRTLYIVGALACFALAALWFWGRTRPQYALNDPTVPQDPWWIHASLITLFLTLSVVLVCMACSMNIYRIKAGQVIDKRWYDSHTQSGLTLGIATIGAPLPDTHYAAEYQLKLRRGDGKTGWVRVSKSYYQTKRVGDFADVH